MRRPVAILLGLAIACLMFVPAGAQSITGALIGTVRDTQGGVLQGANVRVSSPSLIGGPQHAVTDDRGRFRFPALAPGEYTLDIRAHGFTAYHEKNIPIGVGATIERPVALSVDGVQESVSVEASGSRIEARESGLETRFGPDDLRNIPVRRFSMFDFIRAAPGISATSPGSMTTNSVSAFGSGTNENAFLIDGTNFTCPCSGEARSEPGFDFIREVQVQSVGASAEFGNIQGAVINVVTRQGSDRHLYDASYYGQPSGVTSQPVTLTYPGSGEARSGYERVKYHDFTTNLGGPAMRDRLWFFAGYQYLRDYDSQPGTDPQFPRTYEQDKVFAKLTWRLTPGLQMLQSFHKEFWVNPELPTSVKPFETTQRRHATVPAVTFAHLTHTLSSNTVWDARVGRFVYTRHDDPSTGDVTTASRRDRLTGVLSGAPPSFGGLTLIRTTGKATLNHFQSSWLGADHQWRIGAQVEKGEHHLSTVIPTGTRYVDQNGRPFQSISSDPSIVGGVFVTAAGFASNAITVGDRLTINAGMRFDHSRAISQELPVLDAAGRETEATLKGLGTLYTWNVWSPRVGVTMKLTGDGRAVLRASYGRFHQGVLTGELAPFHPGAKPETTVTYNPATGETVSSITVVPGTNLQRDSEMRTPRTDEYSVGIDRQVGRSLAVAAAYVGKSGGNFIGWTDVGGVYQVDTAVVPGLPVYRLVNLPSDRRFLLTNPANYALSYNGIVLAAEKRRSRGWQAFGSYTYSRASGLQASSGASAAAPQSSTIAGNPYLTFGQDPNSLTNATGLLPNDRPHMFRLMGTVDVPRTGVVVAANVQHVTGKPWAATTQVALRQGDQRILLEPRGTRRLSSQTLVDLRVARTISIGSATRIELLLDVFNLLQDTAEESVASDNLSAANFGQANVFVDPRRVMFGVRLNLGK